MTQPISETHPEIAREWHPTKNNELTPSDRTAGSEEKVWWQCSVDPSHEWQAPVRSRTQGGGCPFCSGRLATPVTSIVALYPEIAKEWHPKKNGDVKPEAIRPGAGRKVWWQCSADPSHEWQARVQHRVNGSGCPYCVGKAASKTSSLAAIHADLAKEWHPTKNGDLSPGDVTVGSTKKVWWQCSVDPTHEWQAVVGNRTKGAGCPICAGRGATDTTSLRTLFPELASEWHSVRNADLSPDDVRPGSARQVWWQCGKDASHEWQASIAARVRGGMPCPICGSLQLRFPKIAAEWHPTKNKDLSPRDVKPGSNTKVWWCCSVDTTHEWKTSIAKRVGGTGCPICAGNVATRTTSLRARHPELAAEWDTARNDGLTPDDVTPRSDKLVWWQCSSNSSHVWQATVSNRVGGSGCPACNKGWTISAIRGFVASLLPHLSSFTPAELYLLFQQNGLLRADGKGGKGKTFVKALVTGRFPPEEIQKFTDGEPSLVDEFVDDKTKSLEDHELAKDDDRDESDETDLSGEIVDEREGRKQEEISLPVVQAKKVLSSLDSAVVTSADEEAAQFLVESAKAKLWRHAFHDEDAAVEQAKEWTGGTYAERVRQEFLDEYERARKLEIPEGYTFSSDGHICLPNLMQRVVASSVQQRKRVGNWSGTGAGKTLSAVLASRVVGARLTVVCCPNSVVDGWEKAVMAIFPDSIVRTKTFSPDWCHDETGFERAADDGDHRYLILNFETFQQRDSGDNVRALVEREKIDFVVVDEIHFTKQRYVENMSRRKQLVTALVTMAGDKNPDLHVIGMSATPVINNLQEGKSLVELVTSTAHDELETRATVSNCMRLHQRLVTLGIRWMPEYDAVCQIETPEVDCSDYLDQIRALGSSGSPLALEQILTDARLSVIREDVERKTFIYTHYIQGIDRVLREALEEDGWRVGFYTGEDKSGLNGFIDGDIDVLIGSSAIGTGVDGLQRVCAKLIVNVLPWTNAEFEQLKGRIYRQGQIKGKVRVIIPITYAHVQGNRWSWCESKMNRLRFKKSIADAAVDGVVPEGHLRSPAQAYQDVIGWLQRLDDGKVEILTRPVIVVPLPETNEADVERRGHRYGDFSTMNRLWNQSRSETTHQRLSENPEEWQQYHTLYRKARQDWPVVPYEEMIRWCNPRNGYEIGDFGCGEAFLAKDLSDRHTIHSFDHVAINENVVACDLSHVPLDNDALDVAIFSLSLMGKNFTEYLREAHRTLKLDGHLHIIEATSRFRDREQFARSVEKLGFSMLKISDMSQRFTHLHAIKCESIPVTTIQIEF